MNAPARDLTSAQPRARGIARIGVGLRGGVSRLSDLHQAGAMKVLFPRLQSGCEAVQINTAGGVTGGDRFEISAKIDAGAALTVTTQAAERIYKAKPGEVGRITTRLEVGAGGRLNWLPQETILFDNCALERRLDVALAPGAEALICETLVFGRLAMGETLRNGQLRDRVRVTVGGVSVWRDGIDLNGDMQAVLDRGGVGAGARAVASVLLVSDRAEAVLAPVRAALGLAGGASLLRDGVLAVRALADDSYLMRRALIPALQECGAALPAVWRL